MAGQVLTYAELRDRARSLAGVILREETQAHPLVAFIAYRSAAAYCAVLGILAAGKGYVPLNPNFPGARTRTMLDLSGCGMVVVAPEGVPALEAVLDQIERPLVVLLLEGTAARDLGTRHGRHRFVDVAETGDDRDLSGVGPSADSTAYLLFTSGSTGTPKGVPVSQRNVGAYLDYILPRYGFTADDRFSQTFDMTFDLSVHDMFVCWASGASLVAIPHASVLSPTRVIRDARITVWFSVPSVIMFMQRLKTIKPGVFPSLRVSLFCGEPLLESWAGAWQDAAPNSLVENVYGPTEATIAISHYRWNPTRETNRCRNGIVPIGTIFGSQSGSVRDATGRVVSRWQTGELCLAGTQVTAGYLNNPEKTAQQFVTFDGDARRWYRTGDLVFEDGDGVMQYVGRTDHQVQINGHRVELQEVDEAVRRAAGNDAAIAVAWPMDAGRADAVYVFLCAPPETDTAAIQQRCAETLPTYMVPKRIFLIREMPSNANGKIDRAALTQSVRSYLDE